MTSNKDTKRSYINQLARYKAESKSTLQELADELGYSVPTIQTWLSKTYLPTESNLDNIKIFLAGKGIAVPTARLSDDTANEIIRDLQDIKEREGLTLIELAERIGMHETVLGAWFQGASKPGALNAYHVRNFLASGEKNLSIDNVFNDIFQTVDNFGNVLNLVEVDGVPYTTSRMMAMKFNKDHRNTLRELDRIAKGVAQSCADPKNEGLSKSGETTDPRYFIESSYIHEQNKQEYREILVSKKGCLLYMFNIQGYQAEKMLFIESFERMEQALKEKATPTVEVAPEQQELPGISDLTYIKNKIAELQDMDNLADITAGLDRVSKLVEIIAK